MVGAVSSGETVSLAWGTKYFIFHMRICRYLVWVCLKAFFVFLNGIECDEVPKDGNGL